MGVQTAEGLEFAIAEIAVVFRTVERGFCGYEGRESRWEGIRGTLEAAIDGDGRNDAEGVDCCSDLVSVDLVAPRLNVEGHARGALEHDATKGTLQVPILVRK